VRGTAGSACGGRDREWHQMLLLEFGLFQIPHLSVCLDSEQSVANASTENQRISADDGLRSVVRPGLDSELESEQRFLLRVKIFFGDDALGLEFRQHPKLLFEVWRLRSGPWRSCPGVVAR